MFGTKGFSVLEMLVVLLIIGLLGTLILPNLAIRAPDYERKEFLAHIQGLVQIAWQQALKTGKIQRVFFDLKQKEIRLEQEVQDKKQETEKVEVRVIELPYIKTRIDIPSTIVIKQFFIDGTDVLNQPGVKVESVWFYIVPEGLSQTVIINCVDIKNPSENEPTRFGLAVNPLTAHVSLYENFVNP